MEWQKETPEHFKEPPRLTKHLQRFAKRADF
jgi:hypothetical protein